MTQENRDANKGTFERMGEQLGGAAGQAMGKGSDMAAGMLGSFVGAAMNTLGDWWTSSEADQAARSFGAEQDRSCEQHFKAEAAASTDRSYDDVRPLYQFGHMAGKNPDYQGRSFDQVEPDLQRAWDEESRRSHGEWPEVRGYVGFGYGQEERPGLGDI